MILRTERIAHLLDRRKQGEDADPLVILPRPDAETLRQAGAAAVDLRLGTWFATFRPSRAAISDVGECSSDLPDPCKEEPMLTKMHYVPFGSRFILHPRAFILGVTLEWMRVPKNLAGYVTSRSSWGRRGLIIATAVGVHPGFSGCLTLELTNVGETPLSLYPGTAICQFFIHTTDHDTSAAFDRSTLAGKRKPVLGQVKFDKFAAALKKHGFGTPD